MCGEPPVRIVHVPLPFEEQTLPNRPVRRPERAHIDETKEPRLLVMLTDLADTVETAHVILAGRERSLQYVHIPAPKHLNDKADCAPQADPLPSWRLQPPSWLHTSPR